MGFRGRSNTAERFTNEVETFFPFIGPKFFGRIRKKTMKWGLRCEINISENYSLALESI